MAIAVVDRGSDNQVDIDPGVLQSGTGTFTLLGDGNRVSIGAGCVLAGSTVWLGGGSSLVAGPGSRLARLDVFAARDGHVTIGAGCKFTHHTRLFLHEPGRIGIGSDCLIASGTLLTVSDMHAILDLDSGERINFAKDISIGNKVWLGAEVAVLKGASIGNGSVVGFRSVVTGDVPANCLATGSPARVVRQRIAWRQALL